MDKVINVKWGFGDNNQLVVCENGKWYGFSIYIHPSEITNPLNYGGDSLADMYESYLEGYVGDIPTQDYTFTAGD